MMKRHRSKKHDIRKSARKECKIGFLGLKRKTPDYIVKKKEKKKNKSKDMLKSSKI